MVDGYIWCRNCIRQQGKGSEGKGLVRSGDTEMKGRRGRRAENEEEGGWRRTNEVGQEQATSERKIECLARLIPERYGSGSLIGSSR
jgi:hypothetical protein